MPRSQAVAGATRGCVDGGTPASAAGAQEGGSPRGGAAMGAGGLVTKSQDSERLDRFKGIGKSWELTPEDLTEISEQVDRLRSEQGGERVTAAREMLIESVGAQLMIVRGSANYLSKAGIMKNRKTGEFKKLLTEVLIPAQRELRQTLQTLGLERRAIEKDGLDALTVVPIEDDKTANR